MKPDVVALFEFVGGSISISKELVTLKLRNIQCYVHTTS